MALLVDVDDFVCRFPPARGQPAFRKGVDCEHDLLIRLPHLEAEMWYKPNDIVGCLGMSMVDGTSHFHDSKWLYIERAPQNELYAVTITCSILRFATSAGRNRCSLLAVTCDPVSSFDVDGHCGAY